jgi:uncharacterized protein (DUF305 family)
MTLFSRAFIRRRMISLAATASVTATSFALAEDPARTDQRHRAIPIQYVTGRPDHSEERAFLSGNAAAMKEMMTDMAIEPTGDVDRDFLAMMIPHHQGAVDMANEELEYGHDEQIRKLAQEIVSEQQHQIKVMRAAAAVLKSSATQSPEQPHAPSTEMAPVDSSIGAGGMKMSR